MSLIKKSSFPLHLDVYNVFVTDTDPNSRYFKVTQINNTFTSGKNGFLIQGAPELKEDSYIFVEIKDSAGAVIYSEIAGGFPSEYYEGLSKPVAAHVYDDTTFGAATITIVGELKEWDDNGIIRPIPNEWIGKINVKWQKTITVNPFIPNVSPVRLYKRPEITITERLLPIYTVANQRIILSGSLNGVAVEPKDNSSWPRPGQTKYEIQSINPYETFLNSEIGFNPAVSLINSAPTPFTPDLIDNPISINNIYIIPKPSRGDEVEIVQTAITASPVNWQTTITNLNSSYRANISFPFVHNNDTVKNIILADWSTSYISSSVIAQNISSSYAEVVIKNLDTFTGDIYRIKVFYKSRNDLKGYSVLEDIVIESNELLEIRQYLNFINKRTGVFDDISILQGFWETKNLAGSPIIAPPIIKQFSDFIGTPSVVLQPFIDIPNTNGLFAFYHTSGSGQDFTSQPFNLENTTEYTLNFKTGLSGSVGVGYLDVYMSGSAFVNTNSTLQYGKKLMTLTGTGIQTYDPQSINFVPDYAGNATVSFIVRGGTWELGDISIKPTKQSGFTPGELRFLTKPNVQVPSESFDFRFELFDINYNYVPVTLEKTILFGGGNDILPALYVTLNPANVSANTAMFLVSPDGLSSNVSEIGITTQRVVTQTAVKFYSASFQPGGGGQAKAYMGPIVQGNNPESALQEIFLANLNTGAPYPGFITTNDVDDYKITFADFTSSLKLGTTPQRIERIEYYATAGAPFAKFTIKADYTNYTTTTTTTTTSTSTTSTTSTSTTSTTTAAPVGAITFEINNNTISEYAQITAVYYRYYPSLTFQIVPDFKYFPGNVSVGTIPAGSTNAFEKPVLNSDGAASNYNQTDWNQAISTGLSPGRYDFRFYLDSDFQIISDIGNIFSFKQNSTSLANKKSVYTGDSGSTQVGIQYTSVNVVNGDNLIFNWIGSPRPPGPGGGII